MPFLLAGYNPRTLARRILFARVRRHGRWWTRTSELIQLECGDFAWYGNRGLSWGEQLQFIPFFTLQQPTVPKTCKVKP